VGREQLTVEFLQKHYVKDKKSTVAIAKMIGGYPEQVNRALKKFGLPIRSKSKASRNFYKQGGENSRKGYQFTEEEKDKASIVAKDYWLSDASADAKAKISKSSQAMWNDKTDQEKAEAVARLHAGCRVASQQGSRAQKKIAEILRTKYGYATMEGVTELAGIGNLEVDIALPQDGLIIEVDGITHFKQVYSDNRYERAQEHDKRKNDIMTGAGWSVIRVQLTCERYSKGACLKVCEKLNKMISEKNYAKRDVSYVEMV
jgi:very-short-patch-repair endonuclease